MSLPQFAPAAGPGSPAGRGFPGTVSGPNHRSFTGAWPVSSNDMEPAREPRFDGRLSRGLTAAARASARATAGAVASEVGGTMG